MQDIINIIIIILILILIYRPSEFLTSETRRYFYTTEDGKHHRCTLIYTTAIFKPDSWSLEYPDGFVQHLGNYVKE